MPPLRPPSLLFFVRDVAAACRRRRWERRCGTRLDGWPVVLLLEPPAPPAPLPTMRVPARASGTATVRSSLPQHARARAASVRRGLRGVWLRRGRARDRGWGTALPAGQAQHGPTRRLPLFFLAGVRHTGTLCLYWHAAACTGFLLTRSPASPATRSLVAALRPPLPPEQQRAQRAREAVARQPGQEGNHRRGVALPLDRKRQRRCAPRPPAAGHPAPSRALPSPSLGRGCPRARLASASSPPILGAAATPRGARPRADAADPRTHAAGQPPHRGRRSTETRFGAAARVHPARGRGRPPRRAARSRAAGGAPPAATPKRWCRSTWTLAERREGGWAQRAPR